MSTLEGGGNIITDGLVLYFDAANTKSYVSGSTTWTDISRSGINGTLTNGPTYDSANGGSIVFDGVNDFVNCGSNTSLDSTSITVSCFFKPTDVSKFIPIISKKGTLQTTGWEIDNSTGVFRVTLRPSSAGSNNITAGALTLNNWYYGTFTYDTPSNLLKLYLNGNLVGSVSGSSPVIVNSGNLYIGKRDDGVNLDYFTGNISTTQIYNRALTSTEILQNFNAQKSRFGL